MVQFQDFLAVKAHLAAGLSKRPMLVSSSEPCGLCEYVFSYLRKEWSVERYQRRRDLLSKIHALLNYIQQR